MMIKFGEIMFKKRKGLLHILGEKEKAETFWNFPNKNDSDGEHEFEYQKNILSWMVKESGFSRRDQKRIKTLVNFLGERYRNKNGKFDFRVSARNFVSKNKEPMVNHPLGVAIIALALLDEGLRNRNVPLRSKVGIRVMKKKKRAIVFAGMLHDFCEDKKGDEHCIRDILQEIDLPRREIQLIVDTGKVLTRERTPHTRETSEHYILRISHCKNPIASFLKGVDIVHNALSPHKETQKAKYKSCYVDFVLHHFPFAGLLLPSWLKERIYKENEYLRTIVEKHKTESKPSRER